MPRKLCTDAAQALAEAEIANGHVRLVRHLPKEAYQEVNEAMKRLGGKWKGGKTQAHVFPGHIPFEVLVRMVAASGEMPPAHPHALFPTPAAIAEEVINLADVDHYGEQPDKPISVLEPSAGLAGLLMPMLERCGQSIVRFDAVEVSASNVAYLQRYVAAQHPQVHVHEADFLTWERPAEVAGYDRIVMNPPFLKDSYIRHIFRAWEMLRVGGCMVAIAPATFLRERNRSAHKELRKLVFRWGMVEPLDEEAFKERGTTVATVVITLRKFHANAVSWADQEREGFANGWTYSATQNAWLDPRFSQDYMEELLTQVHRKAITLEAAKENIRRYIEQRWAQYTIADPAMIDWPDLTTCIADWGGLIAASDCEVRLD